MASPTDALLWMPPTWNQRLHGSPWRPTTGAEPDAGKVARPGVRPAKAGVCRRRQSSQGKSPSPGARRAGGRDTTLLKPLDRLIVGMGASFQAVAHAKAVVAPSVRRPGGRAGNRQGEGSLDRRTLADAAGHSGGVGATAWGQGRAKQLEKPSASHRASGGAREGVEPVPRDIDGRRAGGGGVRRSSAAGECLWSDGTRLVVTPLAPGEAGVRGHSPPSVCKTSNGGETSRRRLNGPGGSGACRALSARGKPGAKPLGWPRRTMAPQGVLGEPSRPSKRAVSRRSCGRDRTH